MDVGNLLKRKWGAKAEPKPRGGRVEISLDPESEVLLRVVKAVKRTPMNQLLQGEVKGAIRREAELLRQTMSEEQWNALVSSIAQEGQAR